MKLLVVNFINKLVLAWKWLWYQEKVVLYIINRATWKVNSYNGHKLNTQIILEYSVTVKYYHVFSKATEDSINDLTIKCRRLHKYCFRLKLKQTAQLMIEHHPPTLNIYIYVFIFRFYNPTGTCNTTQFKPWLHNAKRWLHRKKRLYIHSARFTVSLNCSVISEEQSRTVQVNDCVDPQLESCVWTHTTDLFHGPLMVIRVEKAPLLVRLRPEWF